MKYYCYYCIEYAGHAQSLVNTFDLSSIDAIVIVSGDGLLYEVSRFCYHLLSKHNTNGSLYVHTSGPM